MPTNETFAQVKERNVCRQYISNVERAAKVCIEREADWLIILDHVRRKSPGTRNPFLSRLYSYFQIGSQFGSASP